MTARRLCLNITAMAITKRMPPRKKARKVALGKVIAALRTERALTQALLARKCDIDPQHLSKIERGLVSPRVDTVDDIASALGVTVDALLSPPKASRQPTRSAA